jgi:hypothetical protein
VDDVGVAGTGEDGFVRVYSTPSVMDGHIARGRLESEGIPVYTTGEGDGPYRLGPVHLFVPAGLEVQARLILADSADRPARTWRTRDAQPGSPEPERPGDRTD